MVLRAVASDEEVMATDFTETHLNQNGGIFEDSGGCYLNLGEAFNAQEDTGVPFHQNFNSILRRDHKKKKKKKSMSVAPMSR